MLCQILAESAFAKKVMRLAVADPGAVRFIKIFHLRRLSKKTDNYATGKKQCILLFEIGKSTAYRGVVPARLDRKQQCLKLGKST